MRPYLFYRVKQILVGITEFADRVKRFVRVFKSLLIAVNDSTAERSENLVGEFLAGLVHLFRKLVSFRVLEERFDLALDYALRDRIKFLRRATPNPVPALRRERLSKIASACRRQRKQHPGRKVERLPLPVSLESCVRSLTPT